MRGKADVTRTLLNLCSKPTADIGRTLFDHLVGEREQHRGHLDAKRSRRLKVDDKLELATLSGYVRAKGRRRQ
jgi:hypothetical protein